MDSKQTLMVVHRHLMVDKGNTERWHLNLMITFKMVNYQHLELPKSKTTWHK